MTPHILALCTVVAGFTLLLLWVFWPGNKQRLEDNGRLVFDDEDGDRL